MKLSHSRVAAVAAAIMAFAVSGAVSPALAQGNRAGHVGGFHGGGFHGGFAGGGFRGGRSVAGLGGFHHGGFHNGGFGHRGYGGGVPNWGYASGGYYNPGYDGGYGYDGLGFGLAAGLLGGAFLAAEAPYVGYDSGRTVGYCETHFKSYNPASGTYLGYDGLRHHCP